MILQNVTTTQEELINLAVLNQLVVNYCVSNVKESQDLPIDSLFAQINITNSILISVDLKPLIMQEVYIAVGKIVKKIEMETFMGILNSEELSVLNRSKTKREYVAISSIDEISFIKMDDIMYCKADGKYTRFFLSNGESCLSCKNLGDYEDKVLDTNHFFRVHNSYIVNMRFVGLIDKRDGFSCRLLNGFSIPISIRKLDKFNKFIRVKF